MHVCEPSFHNCDKMTALSNCGLGYNCVQLGVTSFEPDGCSFFERKASFYFESQDRAERVAEAINRALADMPSFDFSKQIETLGADSLLPGWKRAKQAAE